MPAQASVRANQAANSRGAAIWTAPTGSSPDGLKAEQLPTTTATAATPRKRIPKMGRLLIERDKICTDAPSKISTVEEANYVPFSFSD